MENRPAQADERAQQGGDCKKGRQLGCLQVCEGSPFFSMSSGLRRTVKWKKPLYRDGVGAFRKTQVPQATLTLANPSGPLFQAHTDVWHLLCYGSYQNWPFCAPSDSLTMPPPSVSFHGKQIVVGEFCLPHSTPAPGIPLTAPRRHH